MDEQDTEVILPPEEYFFLHTKILKVLLYACGCLVLIILIYVFSFLFVTYQHRNDSLNQSLADPGNLPGGPIVRSKTVCRRQLFVSSLQQFRQD